MFKRTPRSVLIEIQPDATACRYLFTAKSLYMFRVSQHPSTGVLKTVTATSGTGHNTGTATFLQRVLIGTGLGTIQSRSDHAGRKKLHRCCDLYRRLRLQFLILLMMGAVTPETCRVTLQWINICMLLHLVGFLLTLNCDARNHEFKKKNHVLRWSEVSHSKQGHAPCNYFYGVSILWFKILFCSDLWIS